MVVDDDRIGVIVKSWSDGTHEVYVRSYNGIQQYDFKDIRHFIYSKTLLEDEYDFYS